MSPLSKPLADLKVVLQDLESHVQLPRDEELSINRIIAAFPIVLDNFISILSDALKSEGNQATSKLDVISEAYGKGWLKGDKVLWLRLLHDHAELMDESLSGPARAAIAEDVRGCSYMFWESYGFLNARFRWQTQVRSVPVPRMQSSVPAGYGNLPVIG